MAGIQIDGVNNKIDFDDDADTSISSATDDTLVVEVGGSTLATVTATSVTFNDGVTITTADNTDTLTLTSTDADANAGPNIVLNRDSGSPADNDIAGQFTFRADNDAGEATDYCRFRSHLEDVSNGSEDGQFRLFTLVGGSEVSRMEVNSGETVFNQDSVDVNFRVESNANSEFFKIDANAISGQGAVGIGAVNTARTFNITTPSSYSQFGMSITQASTSAPYGIYINYTGAAPDSGSDYSFLDFEDTGGTRFQVYSDGDVKNHDNSYGQLSDQRIKDEIVDANSQWDDIKAVKVRNFKRKDDIRKYGADKAKVQIGLIAQELESVSPNLVDEAKPNPSDVLSSSEFGTLYQDGDDIPEGKEIGDVKEVKENVKGIKYSVLYMKAIKALQEAMTRIETLETKVATLEGN
jgi:hypothetical protein